MSRCFPFPPSGYERKHRQEDLDLLKEVKQKEKRQRKEKKEKVKEKRKDREKKEKNGSGEKQKDKKDRKGKHKDKKEKHRDKKKDKEDLGKDKEKSSISEESTVAGKLEEDRGEKFHPEGHIKDRSRDVCDGKNSTIFQVQNGGKPFQAILPCQATQGKFVQELDRRIRDDEKGGGSRFLEGVVSVDKRNEETAARTAFRNPSQVLAEEKGSNRDKRVDIRKLDTQGVENEFTGKAIAPNLNRVAISKVEGILRPVEEKNNWRLDNKEKYKETGHIKQDDEHKDRNKKSHRKDRDNGKEKKREEIAKVKLENKKSEHDKFKIVERNDLVGATSYGSTNLLKDVESTALDEGDIWKRRHMDANGFHHESEIRPNKIQRPTLYQSTETGGKPEASRIPSKSSSNKHAVPNNILLDQKDQLINGIIKAQKPSPSKPNPSAAAMVSVQIASAPKTPHHGISNANEVLSVPMMQDHIAETLRRPPHPDSKYLSQVLTVPSMGNWSENDEQEWFLTEKGPPSKPNLELAGFKEDLCVWSEAVHIESADVYALPYVIPY